MGKSTLKEMLSRSRQLAQQRRWDEAISLLEEVISLDDECMDAWLEKGKLLNRLGRIEEALEVFDTMIGFAPQEADWWYQRGLCLTRLGRHDEALQAFREASRLNPQDDQQYQEEAASLLGMFGAKKDAYGGIKAAAEYRNGNPYTSGKSEFRVNLEFTWNDGTIEMLEAKEESDGSVLLVSSRYPACSLVINASERIPCNYSARDLVSDIAADLVADTGDSWFYVFPRGQLPAFVVRNYQEDGTGIWYDLIATDRFLYILKRTVKAEDEIGLEFARNITGNFQVIRST